jgi:hypothetical protein
MNFRTPAAVLSRSGLTYRARRCARGLGGDHGATPQHLPRGSNGGTYAADPRARLCDHARSCGLHHQDRRAGAYVYRARAARQPGRWTMTTLKAYRVVWLDNPHITMYVAAPTRGRATARVWRVLDETYQRAGWNFRTLRAPQYDAVAQAEQQWNGICTADIGWYDAATKEAWGCCKEVARG